jgi:hypothetical protein
MVRYDIAQDELDARIDAAKPSWRTSAQQKTQAITARGHYDKSIDGQGWGDIKSVYMTLQANKCAYCERKLAGPPHGSREHDVEHFRPKSRLRAWPHATMHRHLLDPATGRLKSYGFPLGSAHDDLGYALLAFHPLNYCTACARCNQSLKSDFFPVRATRQLTQGNPARMKSEKRFLIYPIGTIDDDPRTLITFAGVLPRPVAASGFARERAEVTIDFFALASEDLAEERADIIKNLYFPLKALARGPADPDHADAREVLALATSPQAPHSTCSLAFQQVFLSQPGLARRYYDEAVLLLKGLRTAA